MEWIVNCELWFAIKLKFLYRNAAMAVSQKQAKSLIVTQSKNFDKLFIHELFGAQKKQQQHIHLYK